MAKKADGQNTYPVNINYFVQKCRAIESAGLNLTLKSENPSGDGVWFRIHHGMTMASYGEKITVTLTPTANGTHVHILSECGLPTQLVDYGKNKSNVAVIFQYLEQGMQDAVTQPQAPQQEVPAAPEPAPAQAAAQEPTFAPETVPAPAPAPQFFFCKYCGKKLPVDAVFCTACGTKLE